MRETKQLVTTVLITRVNKNKTTTTRKEKKAFRKESGKIISSVLFSL